MTRLVSLIVYCAMALGLAMPATAQVDRQMESMFNDLGSMSNISKPGVLMSARGGIVSGGSIQVRNKVVAFPQLVSMTTPRIKGSGGCGGIDLVFGSLSFVSKEQMIEYAKSLASNAATYAFDMGLRAMCPMCQAEMEKLQGWTNKLNLDAKNSCEAAQALVNRTGLKDYSDQRYNEWLAAQNGTKSDQYANTNQGPGQTSPTTELARSNPQLSKQIVQGNIVWRAMKKTALASRITSGDDELLQDIMSFVGTRVVCVPGDPEGCKPQGTDPGREGTVISTPFEHTLTFKDLLQGARPGAPVTVLRCVGSMSETGCLDLKPETKSTFKGIAQRVRERYLGSTVDITATDGMIGRMVHARNVAPTNEDQAYLIAFGSYGSISMNLAYLNESAGREFADHFADAVAARYLYAYLRELLDALSFAISQSKADSTGTLGPVVADAMERLEKDARAVGFDPDLEVRMQQYAEYRQRSMGPIRLPELSSPRAF